MSQPPDQRDDGASSGLFRTIRTSIRTKLLFGMSIVAVIPLLVMGVAMYRNAEQAILAQATDQLQAVRALKSKQLQDYVQSLERQLAAFVDNDSVVSAMKDLRQSFRTAVEENELSPDDLTALRRELRHFYVHDFSAEFRRRSSNPSLDIDRLLEELDAESVILQYEYLRNNPNSVVDKQRLDRAGDRSAYSDQHARYHPALRRYRDRFGLHDLLLADLETGDIVYSCVKSVDFTTSLKDGPFAATNLGRAFAQAAAAESPEFVALLDYEAYAPDFDQVSVCLAAPIFDADQKIGVALVRVPVEHVSDILRDPTGLGRTGETLAVGPDKLLRNDSRFVDQWRAGGRISRPTTILNSEIPVDTEAVRGALAGQTDTRVTIDDRGRDVLSSWQPVTLRAATDGKRPLIWGLVAKIDLDEVREPIRRAFSALLTIASISILAVILAGYALSSSLTRQTSAIMKMLNQIGMGNFEARADIVSDDELGTVAVSLNAMCDNTLSLIQTRDERDQIQMAVQKLKEEVAIIASGDLTQEAEVTDDLTGGIAESINHMIDQLRTIIGNIHEAATQVTHSAAEIQKTTDEVRLGAEQQSAQIVETSSAIEHMAQSIQQVSEHTEQSARVAQQARENAVHGTQAVRDTILGMERIRDQVQDNAKRIKRLGESSQEIGEIVQLIGDIADRTSILALNASIQAAMAGDAGKGFAVVAEEVERLAERANQSAKQIESLIKAIQSETTEAITAMEGCTQEVVAGSQLASQAGQALDAIDDVSKTLAELMHSMTQATREQAEGAAELSKSMNVISRVTQQTVFETKQAAESADNLAALADALQQSVAAFRLPHTQPRSALVFDQEDIVSTSPMGSLILKALK